MRKPLTFGLAALVGAGVIGGVVGGVIASQPAAPTHKSAIIVVKKTNASVGDSGSTGDTGNTGSGSTTTTTAPTAPTTTVPPSGNSGDTGDTGNTGSPVTTTTTSPPVTTTTIPAAPVSYCTGTLSGDQAAPAWPTGDTVTNGQTCTDSVGSFIDEYVHPTGPGFESLPPGGWYRLS